MKSENKRYILTVIKRSSSDYQVLLCVGVGVNHLDCKVFKYDRVGGSYSFSFPVKGNNKPLRGSDLIFLKCHVSGISQNAEVFRKQITKTDSANKSYVSLFYCSLTSYIYNKVLIIYKHFD